VRWAPNRTALAPWECQRVVPVECAVAEMNAVAAARQSAREGLWCVYVCAHAPLLASSRAGDCVVSMVCDCVPASHSPDALAARVPPRARAAAHGSAR